MDKHCNLYYLFLEDKAHHPMREEKILEIQKIIENLFEKIKPP